MKHVRVQIVYNFEYDESDFDGYAEYLGHDLTKEEMMDCAVHTAQDDLDCVVPEVEVSYWED